MTLPETRYARNNGLHVAYQLVGNGPVDVVLLTQWFSNIDSQWDVPPLAAFIRRLARFGRVLIFDKRGTGLSDPVLQLHGDGLRGDLSRAGEGTCDGERVSAVHPGR